MADSERTVFSVMTYNIRCGRGKDDVLDLDRIGQIITQSKAKLVGLQEVDRYNPLRSQNVHQAEHLAKKTNMRYVYSPAILTRTSLKGEDKWAGFGNAVLTSLPIERQDKIVLPKHNTRENRSLAVVDTVIDGKPLTFISTHLGLSEKERLIHIEIIADYIEKKPNPVVLVGDWNEQPGSPTYNYITQILVDAAIETEKELPTFAYHSPDPYQANARIDFIFVSPEIHVHDLRVLNNWASDHLPVIADLSLA
ncbi:MAG: hypothetical protein GX331_06880 [Firmicutes bacterium]|nr:hypothetical protein [Bacillota bacterium]